jgi:flagellar biosynthesis GTPase FlhF
MSKSDQSQGVSVVLNPAAIEKLKKNYREGDPKSNYLAACGGDFQKVADTIIDFGVSRWAALSKHSEEKGRGSLIPGERKTRGGIPGSRKAREPSVAATRGAVGDAIRKYAAGDGQTSIPGSDDAAEKAAAKLAAKAEKEAAKAAEKAKAVEEKAAKAVEEKAKAAAAKEAAKAAKAAPKPAPKAAPAPSPSPSKAKASALKTYIVHYNPHKQTYVCEGAKSEKDAIEEAIANVSGLKAAKIIRVSME